MRGCRGVEKAWMVCERNGRCAMKDDKDHSIPPDTDLQRVPLIVRRLNRLLHDPTRQMMTTQT